MVQDGDYVAIFNNIHRVMQAEKLLKEQRHPVLLIPVPRALQSDCGLALCCGAALWKSVYPILAAAELCPVLLYCKQGEAFVSVSSCGSDS